MTSMKSRIAAGAGNGLGPMAPPLRSHDSQAFLLRLWVRLNVRAPLAVSALVFSYDYGWGSGGWNLAVALCQKPFPAIQNPT